MTATTATQHTPGPWTVNGTAIEGDYKPIPIIAFVNDEDDEVNGVNVAEDTAGGDWQANARLIAAAPKTLDALDKLADLAGKVLGDIYEGDTGWYYQLQSAVQEARRASREAIEAVTL